MNEQTESVPPEVKEAIEYFESLFTESDRGTILLVASKLENDLEMLHRAFIQSKVRDSDKLAQDLLSPFAPLSGFAARTKMAYAYGIIADDEFRDLETIRKIRNKAAHTVSAFSLEENAICDKIYKLTPLTRALKIIPKLRDLLSSEQWQGVLDPKTKKTPPKISLIVAGVFMSLALLDATINIQIETLGKLTNRKALE